MSAVIAVISMKGGVGKSTLAVNLAARLAGASARRTLLWDVDAQGAASFIAGHEETAGKARRLFRRDVDPRTLVVATAQPNLSLLAADLSLRQLAEDLAETEKPKRLRKLAQLLAADHERIVIDGPPGLGELSDQVFRAADLLVVPVVPAPLALRAFEQLREHVARHHKGGPRLLPVFSMVDRRRTLHREALAEHPDWLVIPQASVVERMSALQAPLGAFAPRSAAAAAFNAIGARVEQMVSADG